MNRVTQHHMTYRCASYGLNDTDDSELIKILELLKELDSKANISCETAKDIWEMMQTYPY
ncbi:hypothetical protein [Tepidanaerobacter syntrophicus]|uniref:hypothetical protein n=1 Tax=Tepidanaerobacter syntrophicus TaxID=224999 RepID=UPI001BD5859C|nr:hypothetical protein [Tepidanaerobacter syntrophicus]